MEKYNETYEPEDYVIHDPSRAVPAGDYGLMIAVTGKEQADGYRQGHHIRDRFSLTRLCNAYSQSNSKYRVVLVVYNMQHI